VSPILHVVVDLFEWASGEPTVQRLVPIEKMVGWLFYLDAEAMGLGSKPSHHQIAEANRFYHAT
jgi:hypothetical protein